MATGALIAISKPGAEAAAARPSVPAWAPGPATGRLLPTVPVPAPQGTAARAATVPARRQTKRRKPPTGVEDLLLTGQAVAAELAYRGELTRAALIAGLRERGHGISTTRATELLRQRRVA